jgi:hypothetical protein
MTDNGYTTVTLGNNDIIDCDSVLLIEGEEVFRLREDEGRLLVDCDLMNDKDQRLAKIVRNTPVMVAEGFKAHIKPGEPTEVIYQPTGQVVAHFERLAPRHLKITGVFCAKGYAVSIVEDGLASHDGKLIMQNCAVKGFATAISLTRGASGIGFAGRP